MEYSKKILYDTKLWDQDYDIRGASRFAQRCAEYNLASFYEGVVGVTAKMIECKQFACAKQVGD